MEAWEAHRREIRKKLTPTTVAKQLKAPAAMGVERAIRCIDHTIEKGWIGLREPDDAKASGARPAAPDAPQPRALTAFEARHVRYSPTTGAERDADGKLILDQICRDLACAHCKPRRTEVA